jgi:hypothetical protein
MTTSIKNKYSVHKAGAKRRGISFDLTFDQWMNIWIESGKWHLRGSGKGKFCMCRVGDTGGYTMGNVFIGSFEQNASDANKGRTITEREKQMIRTKLSGRVDSTETTERRRQGQLGMKHSAERVEKRLETFRKTMEAKKQKEMI